MANMRRWVCVCGTVTLFSGLTFLFNLLSYKLMKDANFGIIPPVLKMKSIGDLFSKQQDGQSEQTRIYRWKGKWVRVPGFCSRNETYNTATLRTRVGNVIMNIHDLKNDLYVSGDIQKSGQWEPHGIEAMISILEKDSEMGVLDIGAQVGEYSLIGAMMGRHVVSVDPLVENVKRLCTSVQNGNFTDRVTILFTALSDTYTTVTFIPRPGNLGATKIKSASGQTLDPNDDYNAKLISTSLLDDVIPFVDFKKVFMKIDVEGHEYIIIKAAKKFFGALNIRAVAMEWVFQARTEDGGKLVSIMMKEGFKPVDLITKKPLLASNYKSWGIDVLWLKE